MRNAIFAALAATFALLLLTAEAQEPWSKKKAWDWYKRQPWLVGCNFLPSSAVNGVEMWRAETFDPATIDRELGWAQKIGFNSSRVFLNYVVWAADAEGLKERMRKFLSIAQRRRVRVMFVLLDDCNFAGRVAKAEPQPPPVPGVHNSQWVSSPPLALVADRAAWPMLERYITDVVGAFASDNRVLIWDLYNEPGNSGMGAKSRPLMEAAFAWARAARPSQPLTTGAWANFRDPMQTRMMELSDVVSFHGYDPRPGIEAKLSLCAAYGRPVICTEWLRRQVGNTFAAILPVFGQRRIGCWSWGLVAGRTQTYFPWGSPRNAPKPKQWQHDLFHTDGTPFDPKELKLIKGVTAEPQ